MADVARLIRMGEELLPEVKAGAGVVAAEGPVAAAEALFQSAYTGLNRELSEIKGGWLALSSPSSDQVFYRAPDGSQYFSKIINGMPQVRRLTASEKLSDHIWSPNLRRTGIPAVKAIDGSSWAIPGT